MNTSLKASIVPRNIGDGIAVVFHPVFLLFYVTAALYLTCGRVTTEILAYSFFFTVLVPLVFSAATGNIRLEKLSSRPVALGISFISYLVFFLIARSSLPELIFLLIHASCINLLLLSILSLWKKPSIHAAGMGILALLPAEILFSNYSITHKALVTSAYLVFSGIILFQRIRSGSHSAREVVFGAAIGIFSAVMAATIGLLTFMHYF